MEKILAVIAIDLFGTMMFLLGYLNIKKQINIKKNGIRTKATLIAYDFVYSSFSENDSYRVLYRYTLNTGEVVEHYSSILAEWSYRKKNKIGKEVDIKYLPNQPEKFIELEPSFRVIWFNMGSVLMILTGVGLFILSIFILLVVLGFIAE